ncbi:hypothetical protein J2S54_001775 [Streptomyces sp. DSM 42143]|uniref:hypothetical protein n=1 Tax=unclassified Streptomyces TaxID=2593676 RepID=UPI000BD9D707|nr:MULTISPECIES: hypothetical protein [unclassified Streptomyces]MDN3245404.1 hypothetical protein [Streptomyces sp. ZSW22]MDQ0384955.1 hypothetical protein [Streptomyces sp. DSM 42143]PAK23268.1 hypothetical protein CJD44_29960 [Streptomyces sp. alain-838]
MAPARTARRAAALGLGALWWWAVLRLALEPGAGVLEGAVAVGGWGLSVLPVHCVPRREAVGALGVGRWRRALLTAVGGRSPSRARVDGGRGPERSDGSAP